MGSEESYSISSKPTTELVDIVNNSVIYDKDFIKAVMAELTDRKIRLGVEDSLPVSEPVQTNSGQAEQLQSTPLDIESNQTIKPEPPGKGEKPSSPWSFITDYWDENVTTDERAPILYSRALIFFFTVIFSSFCGCLLMVINLNVVKKDKYIPVVLFFFFGYVFFEGLVSKYLSDGIVATVALNIIAAFIIEKAFWNNYIGKGFLHRRGELWIPLVIGISGFGIHFIIGPLLRHLFQ